MRPSLCPGSHSLSLWAVEGRGRPREGSVDTRFLRSQEQSGWNPKGLTGPLGQAESSLLKPCSSDSDSPCRWRGQRSVTGASSSSCKQKSVTLQGCDRGMGWCPWGKEGPLPGFCEVTECVQSSQGYWRGRGERARATGLAKSQWFPPASLDPAIAFPRGHLPPRAQPR